MALGKPVTILTFNNHEENDQIVLDERNLREILLHSEVKDRKVVVFSILGLFRQGKSFLLDYVLRFLYANVSFDQKIVTKYF
jgi:atlastin